MWRCSSRDRVGSFHLSYDQIVVCNQNQFFLLPPVRWALDLKLLDKTIINFKPPESLEMLNLNPQDLNLMHKKFVWKFGIILYLLMVKKFPFSFARANGGESANIDSHSVKKFAEHIRYQCSRTGGIEWLPAYDMFNKCLAKTLIPNIDARISLQGLYAEFGAIFNYFQPAEVKPQQPSYHSTINTKPALLPNNYVIPETRQVKRFNCRNHTR